MMADAIAIGWLGLSNKEGIAKYEKYCIDNAAYFTAIRGYGFKRQRREFALLHQAIAWAQAQGDGRTMVYAVTANENSALVMTA
jgi:hypothetical protein